MMGLGGILSKYLERKVAEEAHARLRVRRFTCVAFSLGMYWRFDPLMCLLALLIAA